MPRRADTKITVATLKKLKATGTTYQVRSAEPKGFGVQVSSRGTMSFFVRYTTSSGRRRFKSLGGWSDGNTLEQARTEARRVLGRVASGADPAAAAQVGMVTLRVAIADYVNSRVKRGLIKDRTADDINQVLGKHLGDWLDLPLAAITADDIVKRHGRIGAKSKSQSNKAMRWLRAIFNYAAEAYAVPDATPLVNPVTRLSRLKLWYPATRRQTKIPTHDLGRWYQSVHSLSEVPERPPGTGRKTPKLRAGALVADFYVFTLLTGLRKNEALGLEWSRVNWKARTITITDTKARRPHTLPLPDFLIDILRRRADEARSPFVFSNHKGERLQNLRYSLKRIEDQTGIHFTPHDLRRTFLSVAESLDVPHYALKMLANHSLANDVTGGYLVFDVERLRAPMERITSYFMKSFGLEPTAEVVQIAEARGGHHAS